MPGPACYGLGNDRPTVTDANVVLGFINATSLAGGKLHIDRALSEKAIRVHVGDPLSLADAGCGAWHPGRGQCRDGARDPRGYRRARPRSRAT